METQTALVPIPPASAPAVLLSDDALAYAAASRSSQTLDAYRSDLAHFASWCDLRGLAYPPHAPAAASTVAEYITEMAESRKPSTITRRVAAISVAHQAAGFESPTSDLSVRAVLTGIRRTHGTEPRRVDPITIGDLRRIVARIDPDTTLGLRDRALLLVGFAGAFRRSELVALRVEDLADRSEGLTVKLRRSKTDQEQRGAIKAIPFGRDAETCPVRALRAWLGANEIEHGPLFRSVDRHGNIGQTPLTGQAVAKIIKRRAEGAGLDPASYSGHSLRAGFVTTAAAAGRSEREISTQTGHAPNSSVLRTYIRHANVFTDNAANHLGL